MTLPKYQVAFVRKDENGIVSKPLIVLNLVARDEGAAANEARRTARQHRPIGANAFDLVQEGRLVFQERMD